jgi:rod shape-determining protein MreC
MEYQPPPFFHRGPAPLVRLTFFVSLAVLLMVLDGRFHTLESVRSGLAIVVYPLQRVAMAPVDAFSAVTDYFSSQTTLQRENDALRARVLQSSRDLLTLETLAAENDNLRRLLDARARAPRDATLAEILYSGRDPFARKVVIDKGADAEIRAGQAVMDDTGIIGQVTRVFPMLAEVTLITDRGQATPVQVVRNGLRAIAYGDGVTLDLRFMAANADIQNGDVLVTSGIDGTYPPGLPVARVARVERDQAYAFAKIQCVPIAGTDNHRQVLVLAQPADQPPPPAAEPQPSVKPGKATGKRARPRADTRTGN